jgi:hypothetical protein
MVRTGIVGMGLAVVPACGGVLFSQGPVLEPDNVGLGFYSHSEPTPEHSFRHADTFRLAQGGSIRGIRWWGAAEGAESAAVENVAGFEVQIYASGAFFPGALLYSERFEFDQTAASATGRIGNGVQEFVHSVELSDAFAAAAGVRYWLLIAADPIRPEGDGWLWGDADPSLGLDAFSASRAWGSANWQATSGYDSAFELLDVPTPSGAGIALIFGAAGLGRRRRESRPITDRA